MRLLTIVYPPESFFYPFHLIAGIIAGSIFAVILLCLFWSLPKAKAVSYDLGKTDAIALGTLIITIATTGLFPFLINPMLDYIVNFEREEMPNIQDYNIEVTNWGLSPANNVILSMTSANTNFFNFTSEPFLGNLTTSNITIQGNAMYSIPILPPRSHTLIDFKANISQADPDQRLITFVRSDEKVGYHDVVWTILFYLILGILIVWFFIYLVIIKKKATLNPKNIVTCLIVIFGWMGIFSLFYLSYYRSNL